MNQKLSIKVIHPNDPYIHEYSKEEFQKMVGVEFLSALEFKDASILQRIQRRCRRAEKQGDFEIRQKWLGTFYAKEIASGYSPDLTICWINEKVGYGVIANQDIPAEGYIGEYTGVVRKKPWFLSHLFLQQLNRQNDYGFDYTILESEKRTFLIDAEEKGNYTRFINHSDTPNLEPVSVLHQGVMHIILYAKVPIKKGTQLCYDYGPDYWAKRAKPEKLELTPLHH